MGWTEPPHVVHSVRIDCETQRCAYLPARPELCFALSKTASCATSPPPGTEVLSCAAGVVSLSRCMVVAFAGVPETRSSALGSPPSETGAGGMECPVVPVSAWFWLVLPLMLFIVPVPAAAPICAAAIPANKKIGAAYHSFFIGPPNFRYSGPAGRSSRQSLRL